MIDVFFFFFSLFLLRNKGVLCAEVHIFSVFIDLWFWPWMFLKDLASTFFPSEDRLALVVLGFCFCSFLTSFLGSCPIHFCVFLF